MKPVDEKEALRNLIIYYARYWKLFSISVFISACLAVVFVKSADKIYRITSNVILKSEDSDKGGLASAALKSFSFGFGASVDVEDELEVIKSFSLMRQTIKSLQLHTEYFESGLLTKKEKYANSALKLEVPEALIDTFQSSLIFTVKKESIDKFSVLVKDAFGKKIKQISDTQLPAVISTADFGVFVLKPTEFFDNKDINNYVIKVSGLDVAAQLYGEDVVINLPNKKAKMVKLTIEGVNIQKCKDLLNTIVAQYNKNGLEESRYLTLNTAEFIDNRLASLSVELSDAEYAIERFKTENKMFDMTSEAKILLEENGVVRSKILEVETQCAMIESVQDYLVNESTQYSLLPNNLGFSDESLFAALKDYNSLILSRISMIQTTSEQNPSVKRLDQQIDAMRVSVMLSVANLKKSLDIQLKDLTKQNNAFNKRYAESPGIERKFIDIKRSQLIKEQLVVFLMEKKEENSLSAISTKPKGQVVDEAYSYLAPVFPKKYPILLCFLILGAVIPFIYLYIKDMLRMTFSSKSEVEGLANTPVIGEIYQSDNSEQLISKSGDTSSIAELFRLIRTNIQFIINKKAEKVILVTSTQSGEGKSFIAINLAASLGLTNKKVLLVGLDIRSPKLAEYMNIGINRPGVTNFLSDETFSLQDVIIKQPEGLSFDVLTAGPVPPNPGELLLSERLDSLFEIVKDNYDFIIIDSAPVGMVSDTFTLDRFSDMTLYVTRADYSNRDNLKFADSIVAEGRLKKLYLIVNGTKPVKGYGYGYGNVTQIE